MSITVSTERAVFSSLAPLFEWPDEQFETRLARAGEDVAQRDRQAAQRLKEFALETVAVPRAQREITYTSTFDLAPSCSPYLGVHLFGEENGPRARLMTGLRSVAAAAGEEHSGELPDHIAAVLALAPHFDDAEWQELLALVLAPALAKMERALEPSRNPYRHLVAAARKLVEAACSEGGVS